MYFNGHPSWKISCARPPTIFPNQNFKNGILTASENAQYDDDLRLIAATKELAWQAGNKGTESLCWLGLQDAARKRRMDSQRPGSWTGSLVTSDGKPVCKSVTKEQWTKIQSKVCWLAQHVGLWDAYSSHEADVPAPTDRKPFPNSIFFKTTERFLGSLVYLAGTYTIFVPYLKGIYLTLNSWCLGKTADGWPLPGFERELLEVATNDLVPPRWVKIVPRLKSNFDALLKLTIYNEPPEIPVCSPCQWATYVIVDSSSTSFGTYI